MKLFLQLGDLDIHRMFTDNLPGARHGSKTGETPMNKPDMVPTLMELTI